MARTLGQAGRYAREKEEALMQRQLFILFIMAMLVGIAFGFSLGYFGAWWAWLFVGVETLVFWYSKKIFERLAVTRRAWQKGADGEREVAKELDLLPDSYCVIHDISTDYGNLDHVVVGPKGVFAIETKRWKGTISSDGNGGLVVNGRSASKDIVRALTGSIMGIKERLTPLTKIENVFIQGLIVFPISYLEVRWGSTGRVHCLPPEKINHYIENWYTPKRLLNPDEVTRIARGFAALARLEEGFDDPSN